MAETVIIKTIDQSDIGDIELVAKKMKLTLMEVIDPEVGGQMYTDDWLIDRVVQHLDNRLRGKVLIAVQGDNNIGHTILRLESKDNKQFGLFSTIYVDPEYRRNDVASLLIEKAEAWFLENNLNRFVTYTSKMNQKLIHLFEKHGYKVTDKFPEKNMIEISKSF